MENHEGDRANDELIKSLGDTTIIDELNSEGKDITQSSYKVGVEEKCTTSEDLKSDIKTPVIDGESENKFEVSQKVEEIGQIQEGNSVNTVEELTSLGKISGDEPTQVEIQEGKCTLINVHGKKSEGEEGNKEQGIKIGDNYLQSHGDRASDVKETDIYDGFIIIYKSVDVSGASTSDDSKFSEKMEENREINNYQSLTISEREMKETPIEIQDEVKLNDFKTVNDLSSVHTRNHEEEKMEICLKEESLCEHLNESCVHNKDGGIAPKICENPEKLVSDVLEGNICNDKSDDATSKLEESSEVSQTESGSSSNKNEYKRLNGHRFDEDNVLRDENGERFNFNFYGNHYRNQQRYEEIGKGVDDHIYELLGTRCKMIQHFIPFDATPDEPQGFFFASENAEKTEDKLLVLIHGSGVVRAGQWARRIIINDNLMDGSQIPYIERAYEEGYEVVVLNTNQNEIDCRPIRGSKDAEQHALYVWDKFIMGRVKAKHIAIMAHSYGGVVTVSLAKRQSFRKRVFAIGFSDSVHTFGLFANAEVKNFFKKCARNWVASEDVLDAPILRRSFISTDCIEKFSAGHGQHEWTSTTCMESVFRFFKKKLEEGQEQGSEVDQKVDEFSSNKIKATGSSDMDFGQQDEIHDCDSETYFNSSEEIDNNPEIFSELAKNSNLINEEHQSNRIAEQIERFEVENSEMLEVGGSCKHQLADTLDLNKKEVVAEAEDVPMVDVIKTEIIDDKVDKEVEAVIALKDGQVSNSECKED